MKIFVENLSLTITKEELKKLFEEWGKVKQISIAYDQMSSSSHGIVEMPKVTEASQAVKYLNGIRILGKSLKIFALREVSDRRDQGRRIDVGRRKISERRRLSERRILLEVISMEERRLDPARRTVSERRLILDRRATDDRRTIHERRI